MNEQNYSKKEYYIRATIPIKPSASTLSIASYDCNLFLEFGLSEKSIFPNNLGSQTLFNNAWYDSILITIGCLTT